MWYAILMAIAFAGGAVMDQFYGKRFLKEVYRELDDAKEITDALMFWDDDEEEDEAK